MPHPSVPRATDLPIRFPAPPGYREAPVWSGRGFVLNHTLHRVLSYQVGRSGWTDELTEFHEATGDEDHYINVASRKEAVRRLTRWMPTAQPVIIDIGCSSGYMIELLRRKIPAATVLAADYVRGPLERIGTAIPDVPLLHFDLVQCPLPEQSVDGVVLLNVLEHIEDDAAALAQVRRILKTNGVAVIEVPAGPHLYDIYDEQLLHFRRYRMEELAGKAEQAGLEVLERSHLGFFLYPAFRAVKKRNRKLLHESPEVKRAVLSANMQQVSRSPLMRAVMEIEGLLRRWIYYPVGIRCLLACRRS